MTMKPNDSAFNICHKAIDIETGAIVNALSSDVAEITFLGYANEPEAEMRLLHNAIEVCFREVRELLDGYHLTFDQKLDVYNRIPPGKHADDIPPEELIVFIEESRLTIGEAKA